MSKSAAISPVILRPLTSEEKERVKSIQSEIGELDSKMEILSKEWKELQDKCCHPNLPIRLLGEEYMDKCQDCGYVQYCYMM